MATATTPEQVRSGLTLVTAAAVADTRTVAASAETPNEIRAALFAAVPLIVDNYVSGSAALALDWYEELRDAAKPKHRFTPRLVPAPDGEALATVVAVATEPLYRLEQDHAALTEAFLREATEQSVQAMTSGVTQEIAGAFRDTITQNVAEDPDSPGWKRFARPEACRFCKMLAGRGAVYTEATARFAAHGAFTAGKKTGGDCMCIAGPEFGGKETWAEATPMQYVASSKKRTPAQQKALRDYLNQHYPDARG